MNTTRSFRVLSAAASVGLLCFVAACSGGGSGTSTIVLGYSGPLSGGAAAYGENVKAGLELAVADLNEQGVSIDGQNYEIVLESLDDQYSPNTAATNAQRLVEQNDAAVVFIPHSGGIKAAQQMNTGRAEFLLAAYSSDPAILESGNELTMMIPPSFASYAEPFTQKLMDNGASRLGLLGTASEYGQQWTSLISETWTQAGGEVLSDQSMDYSTVTDFAGPVSQTLAENPDAIFVGGPSQPTALIIEEARKQGYEGQFLIMDQAKFEEMELFTDAENLNGSIGVRPAAEYEEPGTQGLVDKYASEVTTERPLTTEVTLHYQSVAIVIKAMEAAGSVDDPAAIRAAIPDALPQIDDQFNITGLPDRFTESGHLINDDLEVQYRTRDGEIELVPIEQPED